MKKTLHVTVSFALCLVLLLGMALPASAATDSFTKKENGYICSGTLTFTPSNNSASANLNMQQAGGMVSPDPSCRLLGGAYNENGKVVGLLTADGSLYCSASTTYKEPAKFASCFYYVMEKEVKNLTVT